MAGACEQVFWKCDFHREVDENCALLGYYAASSDNSLPTFWNNLSVFEILVLEEGTEVRRLEYKAVPQSGD
jgi:hypothetical protein